MNANELLRIVDAIHREKNIDKEIVFEGIEAALVSAAKKHYGEDEEVVVRINREDGSIRGAHNGVPMAPEEISARIGAQTAKQVMIQKIREAERDALHEEYTDLIEQVVTGTVQRFEGGTATVSLGNVEAILPRSEQIPGEAHHPNERVRAVVCEVRKAGTRVKVILSRIRNQLVARLFEQEIPEIADGVIEIKAVAREPGYRAKVAVSSSDQRVDCVGACVGVRGNRIKNIVDELGGERIDIVRFNDDTQTFITNALQPAEVEEVILCRMLGRAIVLVREDNLSLAIGRRGQNVRLASKLVGWDIEIMTQEELAEQLEQAVAGFASIEGLSDELADRLVGEGFLTYGDLSVIEPDDLAEIGELDAGTVQRIIDEAELRAEMAEKAAAEQRRRQHEQERRAAAQTAADEIAEETASEGEESVAEEEGSLEGGTGDSVLGGAPAAETAAEESGDETLRPSPGVVEGSAEQTVADEPPPAQEGDEPPPAEEEQASEEEAEEATEEDDKPDRGDDAHSHEQVSLTDTQDHPSEGDSAESLGEDSKQGGRASRAENSPSG